MSDLPDGTSSLRRERGGGGQSIEDHCGLSGNSVRGLSLVGFIGAMGGASWARPVL
jgi:hypothetical protein